MAFWAITFGVVSAFLWLLSSTAWIWAAKVEAPLVKASSGQPDSIVISDGPAGESSIGGARIANYEQLHHYNRQIAVRNQVAAWISAAAAMFSGAAVIASAFVAP